MAEQYSKVEFRYHSDILGKEVVETMWAKRIDSEKYIFELDSIPFYGAPIAPGDKFIAREEGEEHFVFSELDSVANNSVVLVLLPVDSSSNIETIRAQFKELKCVSEKLNEQYFAMEVVESIDYLTIRNELDTLKMESTIDYAEPCLSDKHKKDLGFE